MGKHEPEINNPKTMSIKKKTVFILLIFWTIDAHLFAQDYCIPQRFTDSYYFRSRDIQHDKNIIYGQAVDSKGKIQILDLDIFYPQRCVDSLEKRPLIILVHGGDGDKTQMFKYGPLFAERGFVVSTITCRKQTYKDNISILKEAYQSLQDTHAAIRFLISHANEYGIDTSAVFVGGQSAGAVSSTGIAYMCQKDFDNLYPKITESLDRMDNATNELNTRFTIKGVIDMFGQIADTCFISFEEAQNIPIIMFHGTADSSLSSYAKSVQISERFKNLGGCYQLHSKTGAGHGLNMSKYYIAAKTGCFIKSILCESCTSLVREIDNEDLNCDIVLPIDNNPQEKKHVKADPSILAQYIGIYKSIEKDRNNIIITMEGGHLICQDNSGNLNYELYPESPFDFFIKEDNLQIMFVKGINDTVSGLTVFIDAKEINFKKKK
jgi:predicted esterase